MRFVLALLSYGFLVQPGITQTERWSRLYDNNGQTDGQGSVAVMNDGTYRMAVSDAFAPLGFLYIVATDEQGDTLWTMPLQGTHGRFQAGGMGTVVQRPDGTWLWAGSQYYDDGTKPDALLIAFTEDGDTLWTKRYGALSSSEGINGLCVLPDGGAVGTGIYSPGPNLVDLYVIRVNELGDTLWTRVLGTPNHGEYGMSITATSDGGFLIGAQLVLSGWDSDSWLVKFDSNGTLLWEEQYGTQFQDGGGGVAELSSGDLLLASVRVLAPVPSTARNATMIRTDPHGNELWTQVYSDTLRTSFTTPPVELADGSVVVGGYRLYTHAETMLCGIDAQGQLLWQRQYRTVPDRHCYVYDLRRTLDGGFILAGTAWDTALVSQDAWLLKVDSFGCLVPGCQIFDGIQEQITDLNDAVKVFPNPVHDLLTITISIPDGFRTWGTLQLTLVDALGRQFMSRTVTEGQHTIDLEAFHLPAGLYYLHLTDAQRWLGGQKVLKE